MTVTPFLSDHGFTEPGPLLTVRQHVTAANAFDIYGAAAEGIVSVGPLHPEHGQLWLIDVLRCKTEFDWAEANEPTEPYACEVVGEGGTARLQFTPVLWGFDYEEWLKGYLEVQAMGEEDEWDDEDEEDEELEYELVKEANGQLRKENARLHDALSEVMQAIKDGPNSWHPDPEVDNDTWNEDAHVEVTLTVRDCRHIKTVLGEVEG